MDELVTLLNVLRMTSSGLSGIGVIAIGFFLYKEGIIRFGKGDDRVTLGDLYQKQIDSLNEHAKIANQEMGEIRDDFKIIKNDISDLKTDVSYMRGKMDA